MRKPIVSVSTLALGLLLGLGLGLGATSCTSTRKHCFYAEGDATCTAEFGEGYFCVAESCEAQNLGCVSVKPSPECAAPYGMDGTTDEMADGMTDPTTSESSTEATTEPDTTATEATDVETTSSGCTQDSDCEDASMPNTPFCVDGACVGCGEAQATACMDADPSVPVCDEGSGACVQCLAGGDVSACEGTTPVCDETNTCVGCKWHEECPDTACRMSTGECFPGPVIEATDAAQLDAAIANMQVIHLQASNETNSVTVPANMVVAILGDGPTSVWTGVTDTPALTVEAGAEVYVQGVSIAATQGAVGILVTGELRLDRSKVVNNTSGGVLVDGGSAIIRSSFVGGDNNNADALEVTNGNAEIIFSTIGGGSNSASAIRCTGSGAATVTNSILASTGMTVLQCNNADVAAGNVVLGSLMYQWFGEYTTGDFHLSGMHPDEINTAASWQPGDPLVDIDGDPRPQDASPTAAGADLPPMP